MQDWERRGLPDHDQRQARDHNDETLDHSRPWVRGTRRLRESLQEAACYEFLRMPCCSRA
jgi:hypothetical protein